MRQLRPPERASITLRDQRPASFIFRGSSKRGTRLRPVANEGDWWNSDTWACEQWDLVATRQDGILLCCCLVRDLQTGAWQMVALYD